MSISRLKMDKNQIDVKENYIYRLNSELMAVLLKDCSSGQNIIWAIDNYSSRGYGYQSSDQINIMSITGHNGNVVKPRSEKSKAEQFIRIREKAEVFTPSWICNKQNNFVDNAWFGRENIFNIESVNGWVATTEHIQFPARMEKTWQNYVTDLRLEISCGEAPYLVSRYDPVSDKIIELSQRIGLLDRKLRVVSENTQTEEDWLYWSFEAYKSIYGYDWQGDNVLLARENLLFTFVDFYHFKFGKKPQVAHLLIVADILSWNIWQMDGLKFVIPDSCREKENTQLSLFGEDIEKKPCEGCAKNDPFLHTGIYCKIMDWTTGKVIKFISMYKANEGWRAP